MALLYEALTGDIIASVFAVRNTFSGRAYSEANFAHALAIEICERRHKVDEQKSYQRQYHGQVVGIDILDLVVDQKVLVEVKNVPKITDQHLQQARTYLLDSKLAVCLLVNFGYPNDCKIPFVRIFEPRNARPEMEAK